MADVAGDADIDGASPKRGLSDGDDGAAKRTRGRSPVIISDGEHVAVFDVDAADDDAEPADDVRAAQ
eukprot:gene49712-32909_t